MLFCICVCVFVCVCVCFCVLGEVFPSLLCLHIKKIEICNLYRLAAAEKDLAHGVLCLTLSPTLLDSQNLLGNFFRTWCRRSLFSWILFVDSKMAFSKASITKTNLDNREYIKTL